MHVFSFLFGPRPEISIIITPISCLADISDSNERGSAPFLSLRLFASLLHLPVPEFRLSSTNCAILPSSYSDFYALKISSSWGVPLSILVAKHRRSSEGERRIADQDAARNAKSVRTWSTSPFAIVWPGSLNVCSRTAAAAKPAS